MPSDIKQIQFKPGLPLEIEIIPIAATLRNHQSEITKPHRTQFYNIFWVQQGTAKYYIDFEPVVLKKNTVLFVNKDRVKAIEADSKHDGKILLFTDDFFSKTGEDQKFLHGTILFNDLLSIGIVDLNSSPSLQAIFNDLETELGNKNDLYHYDILHNLLHNLLLHAERELRKQGFREIAKGVDLDYTILFKDLLEKQYKTIKTVSGYAIQMSVTEKRLAKATTQTVGKSPKNIIDERVMLEAKRLLIHTHLSIKEVGYNLGFNEPTNFIKYFRKHINKTPIEFRESYPNR